MAAEQTLLVTTVKDEGPHILEWVAWHRLCGFDRIMVFQNGSSDLTQRSLKVMQGLGVIEYHANEGGRSSPQIRAYARASESEAFAKVDWCLAIDGDEFFVSRVGDGTVGALIDRIGDADAMLINWRNFGSSGHKDMSDALITERFTRTLPTDHVATSLTGFKSLFRTRAYARIGIHTPKYPKFEEIRSVNGSGVPDGAFLRRNWRCMDPGAMAMAQISHFPIRDAASFLLKTLRGRGHQDDFAAWATYWRRYDWNIVEDRTLADRSDDLRREMARLDALSDGRLMTIRRKSQRIWRQKLADARQDPRNEAFLARILAMIDATGQPDKERTK